VGRVPLSEVSSGPGKPEIQKRCFEPLASNIHLDMFPVQVDDDAFKTQRADGDPRPDLDLLGPV
jgi:hypothetical protein